MYHVREEDLTPRDIVEYLDRFIIGQHEAKKMVAIALRNRVRRKRLDESLRDEVAPKNILMIGPTGVGKTEIARRLARLVRAPFIKVEATKFTEVGYVGRDVESMVRDLVRIAVQDVNKEKMEELRPKVEKIVFEKIAKAMLHKTMAASGLSIEDDDYKKMKKEELKQKIASGELDDEEVAIPLEEKMVPVVEIMGNIDPEELGLNFKDMFAPFLPKRVVEKRMKVREAKRVLFQQEAEKFINMEEIKEEARRRVEESGIIFIDEIDKIVTKGEVYGPSVSREGVQRDLLPLVEGTTVNTRYGPVKTDHILFIAAGAFHTSKPSDLIPELQGRFPIRVELKKLTKEDFERILIEPENSLIKQYVALMATENVEIEFTPEAISEIAHFAYLVNEQTENIGARRLHTVMEKVVEEISFLGPELAGQHIKITPEYVRQRLEGIAQNIDLSKYIL